MEPYREMQRCGWWPVMSVVFLIGVPLLIYFPVLRSEYVAYDDELLIVDNVKAQGLTWEHVRQAFTTYDPELYIPLTLLTEQIEYSIVGHWSSAVSHGISLALHLLNTVLVFTLMKLLLRKIPAVPTLPTLPTIPIVIALVWSIHPLNVEAIAWAAARKDLLSGFFFLGSLCTYLKWRERVTLSSSKGDIHMSWFDELTMTHRPLPLWYWSSLLAFLLGLLAKVSIAPLPFVLLLLEWFQDKPQQTTDQCLRTNEQFTKNSQFSILNSQFVPYFLLSFLFIVVALLGKKAQVHAFGATLLAPFVAIPFYLQKLIIPTGLSILYPFTEELSLAHPSVLMGITTVAGLTWFAWWSLRWTRGVSCAFGIFLLLLAPSFLNVARRGDGGIIDLVVASDRYMYLASLPLLCLAGYWLAGRSPACPAGRLGEGRLCVLRSPLFLGFLGCIGFFGFLTSRQVRIWHDSEALFRNVLAQHQASHIAANNLAGLLAKRGKAAEAMDLYRQSITIRENPRALFNLGQLLVSEKRFREALALFERYVVMKPGDAFGRMQLGGLYLMEDHAGRARPHLEEAVARDPNLTEAHYLLGVALEQLGDRTRAQKEFQETLRLKPDHPHARGRIGGSPLPAGEGRVRGLRKPSARSSQPLPVGSFPQGDSA